MDNGRSSNSADHHDSPAAIEKAPDQDFPRMLGPAFGRIAGAEVHGQERRQRREAVGMQPVGVVGDRLNGRS